MNHRRALFSLLLAAVMVLPGVAMADTPSRSSAGHADPVRRIDGADRVATAVELARATYTESEVAVLATARNYPDALSGSVLAHTLDAPLLLTEPDHVPDGVMDLMADLSVDRVVLLGGPGAIDAAVEEDLKSRLGEDQVDRIAGGTRYETAVRVASEAVLQPDTVVLATGEDFPDAVSVSALAATRSWPVLLTASDTLPEEVAQYLEGLPERPQVLPVGGPNVIDESVLDRLRANGYVVHDRAAGGDRYATSNVVAGRQMADAPDTVWVATGQAYPDALTAGAVAASTGGALHLTPQTTTDTDSANDLRALLEEHAACRGGTIEHAVLAGGPTALSGEVTEQLQALLACEPFTEPEPDCHPAYPDFCIPPPPPDKNCSDFTQTGFTVDHTHGDPHRLDQNQDGVACEG